MIQPTEAMSLLVHFFFVVVVYLEKSAHEDMTNEKNLMSWLMKDLPMRKIALQHA
jgi:hypothetical protein